MRHHALSHSRDGWSYSITDGAGWRWLAGRLVDWTLVGLRHPCCGRGIGRIGFVCDLAFRFMQWPCAFDYGKRRSVAELAVTDEQAKALSPIFYTDMTRL